MDLCRCFFVYLASDFVVCVKCLLLMRTIFIFVYILLFASCQNSDKSRIAHMIDEWDGKEIIYPDDLVFTTMGEDTAKWFLKDSRYTIVTYADSIGCMGCKLKLPAWKDFISYLDSVSDHAVKVIFILHPRDEKEMAHALEAVFTHNHYSVDVVYNGIDAADWAESGNYDGMILDIMMPGKSGLEVLREWTESIHHQIERLNSLVTQLLTLAKMEEGGGELELKTWNASETIMDAVTSFEASVVTKQIALQSDIAEEVHMEGDAARIHQLVSLLVDNAVKYTPEGGKIHIFWRKNGKKAEFSVQNTCDTLPEGDLNRLFGRFYRADASRARGKRRLWNRPFRGCCNCKGT